MPRERKPVKKPDKPKKQRTPAQEATIANLIAPLPGDVRNPVGQMPLLEVEKHARTLARLEIAELYPRLKAMTVEELLALNYKKLPVNEAIFVRRLQKDLKEGSTEETHKMYDRLLGRSHITATIETKDISGTGIIIDVLGEPVEEPEAPTLEIEQIQ